MQFVKTYFVTGATGAVGSALVPLLLEDSETQIKLLIRADSSENLTARLESLFGFWAVAPENADFLERVQALRGDATAPRFGLDEAAYDELCADCTHIVHAAGNVRMNLPLEKARLSAVSSAQNIVEFARACPLLKKVEFVSTVGVGGRLPLVPEDWLTEPRAFHNTYEQAKAEAEDYIQGEVARGLPLTVHRPSMVVGDSQSGKIIHFQIFYHLCEFLSGRKTLGLLPRLGMVRLDTVPVDFVARVIAWSISQADLAGRILHLCAGPEHAPSLTELRERVRQRFAAYGLTTPPRMSLPPQIFTGVLGLATHFMDEEKRRAVGTLPVFVDYLASDQHFENSTTALLLEAAKIALPRWDAYINTVLDAYLSTKYPLRC